MKAVVYQGDCLDILAELPEASVDAVVTDPPYELGFMGKKWDGSGIAFQTETWELCLRALKPGGHLLAFGGSRTWHRLAVAIEDAGFDVRDSIAWLYGSGFPKSLDVSKAIDKAAGAERGVVGVHHRHGGGSEVSGSMSGPLGTASELPLTAPATDAAKQWAGWGTALKPAFEPIVVARKPLIGTVAANVLEHGTGALNIDACRVAHNEPAGNAAVGAGGARSGGIMGAKPDALRVRETTAASTAGRWPTNAVLDHHQAAELDQQSGVSKSGVAVRRNIDGQNQQANGIYSTRVRDASDDVGYADSGGASRFFPTFKYQAKAPAKERPKVDGVAHPTVKPLALMRWLVKLVTPPGGIVLDPFAGSGTTIEAALLEQMNVVGIEREAEYIPLIQSRLDRLNGKT